MSASANDRREVLVVEDEPRVGQMLGQAMVELGYRAAVVRTGEEALKAMADRPRPIVLLDLNLPGMTGLQCLTRIRETWPDTAAIILTGFGDLEAAKQAIHLDVVEFLTKPAHLGDLDVALSRAEQRRHAGDLENLRERFGKGDAPAEREAASGDDDDDVPTALADLERQAILESLARHDGNREQTAAELGISVRTLYYRLDQYKKAGYLDE